MFDHREARQRPGHAAEAAVDRPLRGDGRRLDHGRAARGVRDLARRHRRGASGEAMTAGDTLVDRGADRLEELSDKAEASGGMKAKLVDELRDDSAFLRKLKPGLMVQRLRGDRGIDPSPADRLKTPKRKGAGPNPF